MFAEGDIYSVRNYINDAAWENAPDMISKIHMLNSDLENISRIKSAFIQEFLDNKNQLKNKLSIGFRKYYYFKIAELSLEEHRILNELSAIKEGSIFRHMRNI